MDNYREGKPETKHLREKAVQTLAPNGFLLPHFRTFTAVVNTFSQIYSHLYDEVNCKELIRYADPHA